MYVNGLIKPRDETDRVRLASFARLRAQWGQFLYGVE